MTELTELQAYLDSRAGPSGHWRPHHPEGCPARAAWIPLAWCRCRLRLAPGPALAHPAPGPPAPAGWASFPRRP